MRGKPGEGQRPGSLDEIVTRREIPLVDV